VLAVLAGPEVCAEGDVVLLTKQGLNPYKAVTITTHNNAYLESLEAKVELDLHQPGHVAMIFRLIPRLGKAEKLPEGRRLAVAEWEAVAGDDF